MKKSLPFFFFIFFGITNAQIVNIPDVFFKNALLNYSITIDTNGDGEIQYSEAEQMSALSYLGYKNISDLTGIEAFKNITNLKINGNRLTHLDLSSLDNLETLDCGSNLLTSLNISGMQNLVDVECSQNYDLESIELSELSNLEIFNGNYLAMQNFDASGVPSLKYLSLRTNDLEQINLTGLINLETLYLDLNELDQLDLSTVANLKMLYCAYNSLDDLDVSHLNNLEVLWIPNNIGLGDVLQIDELPTSLKKLNLSSTGLNNLNVSHLVNLEDLECRYNTINNLNISGLTSLKTLYVHNNYLGQIDLSTNISLEKLEIFKNNDLTQLDLSANYHLNTLVFQNTDFPSYLSRLNLKNGSNYVSIDAFNFSMPDHCYICIDSDDYAVMPNLPEGTFVNTYCHISPGGEYNSVKMNFLFDINQDNICDTQIDLSDIITKIKISDTENDYYLFTNSGEYIFDTGVGNYTIEPELSVMSDLFLIVPEAAQVQFPIIDNSVEFIDFCIKPNGVHPDVDIIISPIEPARPGFPATYKIVYRNIGNHTVSGSLTFRYQEEKMDYSSSNPVPDSQTDEELNYNFSDLLPFEAREIIVEMGINTPTETPPVNIGDWLSFQAEIEISDDINLNDNEFTLRQEVVGSFDPNDILCLEGTLLDINMIGEELHYRIRFENTGTYPAERVVVAMPINPGEYDVSSFHLLNTSHQVQARVVDNTAEFFFEDIQLQPNGQGDILFSIKSLNSLAVGDSVMSYADIYFDYNYPITTNEAETTFEILGIDESDTNVEVTIYPNPVKDILNIKSDSKIKSVELYDLTGKLIQVNLINKFEMTQSFSAQSKGIYILKVHTEKGTSTHKIIKQ